MPALGPTQRPIRLPSWPSHTGVLIGRQQVRHSSVALEVPERHPDIEVVAAS
jgi:hypothetical protein